MEFKAPNPYNKYGDEIVFFLAGTIDMGQSEDWQSEAVNSIEELYPNNIILNPRRTDWDSSWEQKIDNPQFAEQVNWELQGLEDADIIIFNFLKDSKSPISFLELGLCSDYSGIYVCCPEGFYRKGNIDIVCQRYGIPVYENMDELIKSLNESLY